MSDGGESDAGRLDAAAFTLEGLRAAHAAGGRLYHEFLRVPALSAGVYVLPAGGDDPQSPHREDEVYYAIAEELTLLVLFAPAEQHEATG